MRTTNELLEVEETLDISGFIRLRRDILRPDDPLIERLAHDTRPRRRLHQRGGSPALGREAPGSVPTVERSTESGVSGRRRRGSVLLALVVIVAACGHSYPTPRKIPAGSSWDWGRGRYVCVMPRAGEVMPACADSIPDD